MNGAVLIWRDKQGDRIFPAGDDRELYASAVQVIRERIEEGYLDPDAEDRACAIVASFDEDPSTAGRGFGLALRFLQGRNDYEYEHTTVRGLE